MDLHLTGVALVVGAGQGIGKATALAFAEAGVRALVLAGRTERTLKETGTEAQGIATNNAFEILVVPTDIVVEEQVRSLLAQAVEKFGRVDYCANIAGIKLFGSGRKPFSESTNEEWRGIQEPNINGMFYLLREEIKTMKAQEPITTHMNSTRKTEEKGSIVVCSSAAAIVTLPGAGPYVHTKHAVTGMTKAAAFDHVGDGIRINSIMPGYIATPGLGAVPGASDAAVSILESNPLHRFGQASEVGDMIVMMSSPRNSFMVGSGVIVDGGQTLTAE